MSPPRLLAWSEASTNHALAMHWIFRTHDAGFHEVMQTLTLLLVVFTTIGSAWHMVTHCTGHAYNSCLTVLLTTPASVCCCFQGWLPQLSQAWHVPCSKQQLLSQWHTQSQRHTKSRSCATTDMSHNCQPSLSLPTGWSPKPHHLRSGLCPQASSNP